jgi:hypothetical protein
MAPKLPSSRSMGRWWSESSCRETDPVLTRRTECRGPTSHSTDNSRKCAHSLRPLKAALRGEFGPGVGSDRFSRSERFPAGQPACWLDWATDAGTLTVIPGYRHSKLDFNGTTFRSRSRNRKGDEQTSLEVRFASPESGLWSYLRVSNAVSRRRAISRFELRLVRLHAAELRHTGRYLVRGCACWNDI